MVAVPLALSVSTLLVAVGLTLKDAVTPLGIPDAASVTLPVNPPTSVTVIVSVTLFPWTTDSVGAEGVSVNPVLVATVRVTVVVAVIAPDVPVMVMVKPPVDAEPSFPSCCWVPCKS